MYDLIPEDPVESETPLVGKLLMVAGFALVVFGLTWLVTA